MRISKGYLGSVELSRGYVGSTLVYQSGGGSYNPDAESLFSRMAVQLSSGKKSAVNNAIVEASSTTWWAKLKTGVLFFPILPTLQQSSLAWGSLGRDLIFSGSAVYNPGHGVSGIATSAFSQLDDPGITSASMSIGINLLTDDRSDDPSISHGSELRVALIPMRISDSNARLYALNTSSYSRAVTQAAGLSCASRDGSAVILHKDGARGGQINRAALSPNSDPLIIGNVVNSWDFAFSSSLLSDAEHMSLYNWRAKHKQLIVAAA